MNSLPKSIQRTLASTLSDLEIRAEVSCTLQSLLADIETSHNLQSHISYTNMINSLKEKLQLKQNELDERRAYERLEMENRIELADKFVGELFVLSVKLNELESWREENFEKVEKYDELERNLERAEESVRNMRRHFSLNSNAMRDPTLNQQDGKEERTTQDYGKTEKAKTKPVKEASLEGMSEKLLLEIFGFLDAYDVLKAAQVNVVMYSKVDHLFGLGHDDAMEAEEDDETSPAPKVETPPVPPPPTPTIVEPPPLPRAVSPTPPPAKDLPEERKNPVASMAAAAANTKPFTKVFSLLQPKSQQNASSSNNPPPSPSTTPHEINPSVASSMADKLTAQELSVIINMTEKLRLKDADITRITTEKDDLAARLEGSESVKEFLIQKVRDCELSLKKSQEETVSVAKRNVVDQEVIAHLDAKVKTLERREGEVTAARVEAEETLAAHRKQSSERLKVIEDMLQFERQQLKEQDREWKGQKKLLVKEIKHCRAQIAALQAERDSFAQQNAQLKQALLNLKGGKR